MEISLNKLVDEQFIRTLQSLNDILTKAETHAKDRGFDPNSYLSLRFAPDMFPFVKQVQIVTDIAKGAVARLTNKAAPKFEDNETTLAELKTRIGKTIEFLAATKPEEYKGYEAITATFPWLPGKGLEGKEFLVSHALPNFYFHATTTYALLRMSGVNLGKADFLGKQNWKNL